MSDLIAATGWITEAPIGDLATLLYHPVTGIDLDPAQIETLAEACGMAPIGDTLTPGPLPPLPIPPVTPEWTAAAEAQGHIIVLLTATPLAAPTIEDADRVTEPGAPTWALLARWE